MRRVWPSLLAIVAIFGPPLGWLWLALRGPAGTSHIAAGPLWYIASVIVAFGLLAFAKFVIRKRSAREVFLCAVLVGSAAFLATLVALAAPLIVAPSHLAFEPPPVSDKPKFAEVYYSLYAANTRADNEFVVYRRWQFDQYGLDTKSDDHPRRWRWVVWEEYGLPLRCFRVPFWVDYPRPPRAEMLRLTFSDLIPLMHLVPGPFVLNVLFWTACILAVRNGPKMIIQRHRSQEGRCTACGYILKGLNRCPECGAAQSVSLTDVVQAVRNPRRKTTNGHE